jgi:hypothetical protein
VGGVDELAIALGLLEPGARCDLPLEHRLQVLEAHVTAAGHRDCEVMAVEYTALPPNELSPVMDVLADPQAGFPLVFVGDRLACTGTIDPAAVIVELQRPDPASGGHP